jgi:thioredoxin-dependent peroxiredoxin
VRDARSELEALGVEALGISPDDPKKQARFDRRHRLGFRLLSDPDHSVAEAYGVWREKRLVGRTYLGVHRSSFLVDEAGRIAGAWYGIKPDQTVPAAMTALAAGG